MANLSNGSKSTKYGQIAGSRKINDLILQCFEYIFEEVVQEFIKRFQDQPDDSNGIMHTFRELILGAYLNSRGFRARHEYLIDNQTPDWSIFDGEGSIICIVECTNFHIDKATELEIEKQRTEKNIVSYWRDGYKDNIARLYQCIWRKATVYKSLIAKLKVPYVIVVFSETEVAIDHEEIHLCLFDEKTGLFNNCPEVSGVLHFDENSGRYSFSYFGNPNSLFGIGIPDGVFPSNAA